MFCENCGASNPDGNKFCKNCGTNLQAAAPVASSQPPEEKKRKKGFFATAPGVGLIVVLCAIVIGGVIVGAIFLLRDSNNTVDAETVKVWDEYESLLEDSSTTVAQITMDPNALTKQQEELKKAQEKAAALEKVLKQTGGTQQRRATLATKKKRANVRDKKADEMAAALAAYNAYVKKLNEFYGALIPALVNNQLLNPTVVASLNALLNELQTLSANVTKLSEQFLANNPKLVGVDFDPKVLVFSKTVSPQVQQKAAEVQAAEQARIQAELAAAQQAAAAAAAAQAEAQRQAAAAAAAQQPTTELVRVAIMDDPCGDPNCSICYGWAEVRY